MIISSGHSMLFHINLVHTNMMKSPYQLEINNLLRLEMGYYPSRTWLPSFVDDFCTDLESHGTVNHQEKPTFGIRSFTLCPSIEDTNPGV